MKTTMVIFLGTVRTEGKAEEGGFLEDSIIETIYFASVLCTFSAKSVSYKFPIFLLLCKDMSLGRNAIWWLYAPSTDSETRTENAHKSGLRLAKSLAVSRLTP